MIYDDESAFRITGINPDWSAEYSAERFDGPLTFSVADQTVLHRCQSAVDDLHEELVLPDSSRVYRKGKGAVFTASGRMPIGSGITFKQTHRYSNSAVKIVKDLFIPGKTVCRGQLALDDLELSVDFTEYRVLGDDLSLSDWQAIPETPAIWSKVPLAIVVRSESGLELEIGAGNDLWRWEEGVFRDSNTAAFELSRMSDRVVYRRAVSVVEEEAELEARSYRFSWYMAWSATEPAPLTGETIPLPFRPNGDVALGSLNISLEEKPGATIVFDLLDVPWADGVLRSDSKSPCFASSQTIKRLKRIMRQLADFKGSDLKLHITNMRPGCCHCGHHVHGKDNRFHWDMVSILDFAIWARQCLGNEWQVTNDALLMPLPSLRDPVAVTDHDVSAVEYEYTPPDA